MMIRYERERDMVRFSDKTLHLTLLKMCLEFTVCTEKAQKQNLFIGFLLGGISFGMSLQADMCYVSLTTACLVVRKWREILIHLSKTPTPKRWPFVTQQPWYKCNRSTSQTPLPFHLPGLLYIHYFGLITYVLLVLIIVSLWAMCDVFVHSRRNNCSIWDKTSHWIIDQVCDEFQELSADYVTWLERSIYSGDFQGHNRPGWKEKCNFWQFLADENNEKKTFATFYRLITRLSFIKIYFGGFVELSHTQPTFTLCSRPTSGLRLYWFCLSARIKSFILFSLKTLTH